MNYFIARQLAIKISNTFRGFLRTITGAPPLTLDSCLDDKSVVSYQIYGNSVQDGEPSPDNPVDVVSVGEKTINLFNPNITPTSIEGCGYLGWDMKNVENGSYGFCIRLKEGKTIPSSANFGFLWKDETSNTQAIWLINKGAINTTYISNKKNRLEIMFTLDSEKHLYRGIGCSPANIETWNACMDIFDIWIIKDYNVYLTPVIDYEPYGYKIPIIARGKNLFDINNTSNWVNAQYNYYPIYIGANETVTLSWDNDLSAGQDFYLNIATSRTYAGTMGDGKGASWLYHNSNTGLCKKSTTKTADDEGFIYINLTQSSKFLDKLAKLQVEYGVVATKFEPYIKPVTTNIYAKEPWRGVGERKDYINSESKKLVRSVAEDQFLSRYLVSKSGSFSGTVTGFLVINTSPFGKAKTGLPNGITYGFNSIGEVAMNANNYNTRKPNTVGWMPNAAGNTTSFFAMPISFLTDNGYTNDLIGAKDWVDAQNAISPIMITYILETPTEEDINLPELPTFKGMSVTYTVNTTVQPTEMTVSYYSNMKGE